MSYYSIIQIVPDPAADERINVGVVAFDEQSGELEARFSDNWNRLRSFVGSGTSEYQTMVVELRNALEATTVRELSANLRGRLQVTVPRASTLPVAALLARIEPMMIKPAPARRQATKKTQVIREATIWLQRVAGSTDLTTAVRFQPQLNITGRIVEHQVDLGLVNGRPLLAAQAISFDRRWSKDIENEVNGIAWLLDDVAASPRPPHMAVLVEPPGPGTGAEEAAEFESAFRLFTDLRADVVTRAGMANWAGALPATLAIA